MFVKKPRSSDACEGDTVIIHCEVIGDPKPEVVWLRDFLKVSNIFFDYHKRIFNNIYLIRLIIYNVMSAHMIYILYLLYIYIFNHTHSLQHSALVYDTHVHKKRTICLLPKIYIRQI